MRIGIMLRHFEQHGGGVREYTINLLDHLFNLNSGHQFTLLYRNPNLIGTYKNFNNVNEVALSAPINFMWDQFSVPKYLQNDNLDIIFNPKYSIPLSGKTKKVFVCHGLDWYAMPWGSKYFDRLNHKLLIPKYCERADKIIAVSETVKEHLIEYLKVPSEKIYTVHLGYNQVFNESIPLEKENAVKLRYNIPEKFFLYVGQIYPPKNFGRIIQAFAKIGPQNGFKFVVAGEHRWLCDEDIALIDKLGIKDSVIWTGWIQNTDLPVLYRSAAALLFPSLYEGFGIPTLEAMASGCPVITSNRYATKEISGGAALLVDPENVDSIAGGIFRMINESNSRNELISLGYDRAKQFNWNKCAVETLQVLESISLTGKTPKRKFFRFKKAA